MELVPVEDSAEPLEQVEAYGTGAHLGLRAQQHCDNAARLEAGAAAHAAFVHDNDALHALLYKVEGGAKTGYASPDYYDGLRSGGWHGVILWLRLWRHKRPILRASSPSGEGWRGGDSGETR